MTQGQALDNIYNESYLIVDEINDSLVVDSKSCINLVNKIYDDFESEKKVLDETISIQHRLMKNGEQRGYDKAKQDFESRTCNNCKTKSCSIKRILLELDEINPDYFSCNDWEKKETNSVKSISGKCTLLK